MRDFSYLLPSGSVVLLKGGNKKVMIMGVLQSSQEDGKNYDYVAVPYPEGYLGGNNVFMFQHSDIMDIIYKGYDNIERKQFLKFAAVVMDEAEKADSKDAE